MREFKDIPHGDYSNTPEEKAAVVRLLRSMSGDTADLLQALGLEPTPGVVENPKNYSLCSKGTHRMTPDNVDGGRCLSCKHDAEALEAGLGTKYKRDQFCSNGHERTPENTRVQPNGVRRCIPCRQASSRKHAKNRKPRNQRPYSCKNNHPWEDGSFKVNARGARRCLICLENNGRVDK